MIDENITARVYVLAIEMFVSSFEDTNLRFFLMGSYVFLKLEHIVTLSPEEIHVSRFSLY